ncbi:hypothetical protein HZH68_001066 [Vespula germanica]|uniref:Odorant receptor n=1 Tax=Vespula germanica TaxID=30212 RepID=A0A834U6J0_VESGE|nr:hypothetical protein HZH68_001066 [Vespula germanica]
MDFFENRYYNINKALMYVIGIWPYQNSKRTLRIILSYTILTVTTIVLIAKFTTTKYDVDLLVDIFTFLIPNLCYYSGYCTCHYNMRKIKKLFDMIKFDWGELKNPEEMAIIKKYATKSKNYTIILTVIFIGFFFIFIVIYLLPHLLNVVVPLNQPRKSKSFPIETFFKIEDSIYGLVLLFFIIASLGVIALAAYGSFLLFIQHACGMLSLTGFILEHVFIDSEQCIYNNNENEMIYKSIIRSIRFHIRTLKFIDFIKDISEECYTIQISLVLILIASDYLKFMQIKKEISENIDDAIICIIHIIGIMFSLFINCHAGQQIIDHSNYVFHKAKVIPWYLVSKKIQKSAIIILMRSQKSCYLEVGRTFISSYEFFVLVLKTSMSYATILKIKLSMENFKEILTCMMHIIGNVAWAFINCYFGQKVIDSSSDVYTKICNSRWYLSSTKMQKIILLIITRSLKPSYVSIGGTFISSLELFASMVQTSISYAMISLSPIGLWPSTERKTRLIRRFIVILNCISILLLQTLKIIMTNYKIDIIFEILPYFLICFAGIFMHLNNSINSSQMYRLLEIIKDDWHEQEGTKEFEVMKKFAQDSKTYSIIMLAIFYVPVYIMMITSTLPLALDFINPLNETRPRTLPFLMEFYVDEQKHFCPLLMIIFVMLLILGLTLISNCTLFLVFIQHLCGMFYVVGNMVDNVFNDKHCSEVETYAKIVRCIKYHKQALEFEMKLRALYEHVYLGLVIIGLFLMATSVIQLIQKNTFKLENPIESLVAITIFISSTIIIYLKCYFGQKLIDHSTYLLNKIFNTPWYLLTKKSQILLWFMMARSTKPCYLSCGKPFCISIQFFASMLQTAVSYAMGDIHAVIHIAYHRDYKNACNMFDYYKRINKAGKQYFQ